MNPIFIHIIIFTHNDSDSYNFVCGKRLKLVNRKSNLKNEIGSNISGATPKCQRVLLYPIFGFGL